MVTPCNSDAAAWVGKWPEWPGHGLIVCGQAGSGKTHLLNLWMQQSGGTPVDAASLAGKNVVGAGRKS